VEPTFERSEANAVSIFPFRKATEMLALLAPPASAEWAPRSLAPPRFRGRERLVVNQARAVNRAVLLSKAELKVKAL
jgi:hypothetical protein